MSEQLKSYFIESREASFCYTGSSEPALKDVSLTIRPGECVLLCGKSGCGKTTFSRLLNGLSPAFFSGEFSGSCETAGLFTGQAAIEDYVSIAGSVFQNPKTQYFNVDTTAEMAFPCENAGLPTEEIAGRVEACASRFGLQKLMGRSIFKLSGGEKQQIAFGAATMLNPKLLVLDEPTSNLDQGAIVRLHDMIRQMKSRGLTIVMAEHRIAWAADLVDRYLFFENGALKAAWSREEFLRFTAPELEQMELRALTLEPYRQAIAKKAKAEAASDKVTVSAQRLKVGYSKKQPVYSTADFKLCSGEITGLMGHNGIGKSTLARTLCGLIKPLEGRVLWNGRPAAQKMLMARSFLVMQDVNYQLFSDSVREEVLLGAKLPEKCDEVLKALGLFELEDRHPMSLSGGQKQRVVIAAAMLSGKELIVLDEPTSGLDHYHMTQVGGLLRWLAGQGRTVLLITHDEELAAGWCDRVIEFKEKE